MGKKIFITGAAGFIGFHMAQYLHKRGDEVIGYDNFNTYYEVKLKRQRTAELKKLGIEVIEGDICHGELLEKSVAHFNPTDILHLAAQAGVRYSLTDPRAYIKANIDGFLNLLEVCRSAPSVALTYASSSSVYGKNVEQPFSIEDRTDHQTSLYGVTKKSNELMAHSYHHLFGLTVTGLRYFTVYGPWGRPDMAYYAFADAINSGRPIDLYNGGEMERDFTFIDDIVAGTAAAIDCAKGYNLYNLGNNHPMKLMDLVTLLEKFLGKKARIHRLPIQPGDVVSTYAEISHSNKHLNFAPRTDLYHGLKQFVAWY